MNRNEVITTTKEDILLNIVDQRAREIAGVLHYLFEKGLLDRNNIYGKVIDIGTGTGAGIAAFKMFGVEEVVGVDHNDSYCGFKTQEILGNEFIHKPAASFLRSLPNCSVRLITAFHANISLAEFYPEVARVLTPGGQILVTTDIPESVGHLGGGVWLSEEDWHKLPVGDTLIAEQEAFKQGKLSFIPSNYCPERDRFVFVQTRMGTK